MNSASELRIGFALIVFSLGLIGGCVAQLSVADGLEVPIPTLPPPVETTPRLPSTATVP